MTDVSGNDGYVRQMSNLFESQISISSGTRCPESRFDTVIEWLMAGLLLFMPAAFGGVQAWSELVILILVGAMAAVLGLKLLIEKTCKPVWAWAYVPVGLFIILAAGQLAVWPEWLIKVLSPNTPVLKSFLLAELPDLSPEQIEQSACTLSFYPWATTHGLRLLLAAAAVFFIVINTYHRPAQIKRLLLVIACIGGGIGFLSLAQNIFDNGKIYWMVTTWGNSARSGPFVNHSHYGQFMNLSIGAALGLLLVELREIFHGSASNAQESDLTLPVVINQLTRRRMSVVWFLVVVIITGITTVFLSLTRGGVISMLIGGCFAVVTLAARYNSKYPNRENILYRWVMVLIVSGAFVCVLYLGFEAVYNRLATLRNAGNYQARWQILSNLTGLISRYPMFGTGLGTHPVVYPMLDRSISSKLSSHVENEYAQVLEETGLVGLMLLLAVGIMVWRSYYRCIKNTSKPISMVAPGLGFSLLVILIHSCCDFGQHIPANAFLSVIFCGLLINLARVRGNMSAGRIAGGDKSVANGSGRVPMSILCVRGAVCVFVWVIFLWAISGANKAYAAERHWQEVRHLERQINVNNQWSGDTQKYERLLFDASDAVACQPDNIEYNYWLNVYRWMALKQKIGVGAGAASLDELKSATRKIVADTHRAALLCPTYGPIYCLMGQLEYYVLAEDGSAGAKHIQTAFKLAAGNMQVCFSAGMADIKTGDIENSLVKFKRYVDLGGDFDEVIDIYLGQVNRPDLAILIAVDNPQRLSRLIDALSQTRQSAAGVDYNDLAEVLRKEIITMLESKCQQPDASAGNMAILAHTYYQQRNLDKAIRYYRRAVALAYDKVRWRLALARLLAENNQVDQAIHETKMCLSFVPDLPAAQQLLQKLTPLSPTAAEVVSGN
jgi:O-antigen ligase/tetratricopeptide (TPR) repeat protein